MTLDNFIPYYIVFTYECILSRVKNIYIAGPAGSNSKLDVAHVLQDVDWYVVAVCSHCMDIQLQPFVHYSWSSSSTRGRRVAGHHPNSLRVEAEYILDKSVLYCWTTWRHTSIHAHSQSHIFLSCKSAQRARLWPVYCGIPCRRTHTNSGTTCKLHTE